MAADEGGESACWLDRICPVCGAYLATGPGSPATPCPRCGDAGAPPPPGDRPPDRS